MGLLRFEIVPSNPHGIYYAGCPIFGKVYLDIDAPKTIRGIEIRYKGEAQVRYPAGDRTRRDRETYLDTRYLIFGDGENETEIEEGCHVFPFSWMLPSKIPCSFEGFYGRVRYSIKAVVDRPWKTDHVVKIPFTVVPILDLNREPLAALPVYEENDKSGWENSDGLRMSVALPVRGYVPGQNVPIKVKLANQSEMVVEKLRVTLKKLVTYKIGDSSRSRKEVIADFEVDVEEGQDLALLNLKIPALPPSKFQHCRLIDIDYKLKVEARLEGWFNKNPKVRMDIVIGTIPLLTYQVPRHATEKSSVVDIQTDALPGPSDADGRDIGFVFPMEIEEYSSSLPKSSFEKCENYNASKREKDEPAGENSEGDSDEEIASAFDPKYTVYVFEPTTPAD